MVHEDLPCSSCLHPGHLKESCPALLDTKLQNSKPSPSKSTSSPKSLEPGILGPPPPTPQHLSSDPPDCPDEPGSSAIEEPLLEDANSYNPFELLELCSLKDPTHQPPKALFQEAELALFGNCTTELISVDGGKHRGWRIPHIPFDHCRFPQLDSGSP